MTTTHRDALPGVHHVWVHATGNEPYFADEVDRMTWIRDLVSTAVRHELTCLAFCQMTTHTHLLLDVPAGSLSQAMQRLNCTYSRRFNLRHGRAGQFVQRRYGNRRIETPADLLGAFAYIALNPVKAGVVPRAEDWRWSSFATTLGITNDFPFVDASLVLAEVGGRASSLRSLVEARWRQYLSQSAVSGRLTTGRGSLERARP
jgi:putative transposase